MNQRIKPLNSRREVAGDCVVYVMSRDQRVDDNHALLAAQTSALERKLPLLVVFFLHEKSGHRAREHYQFMIDGLREIEEKLAQLNIGFSVYTVKNKNAIISQLQKLHPNEIYCDFSPLSGPRVLQNIIATQLQIPTFTVDTHNVVPVWVASNKQEYAARTIRPKITKLLADWLIEPEKIARHPYIYKGEASSFANIDNELQELLSQLASNGQKFQYDSGESAALHQLQIFIDNKLADYESARNDPTLDGQSDLSPYLHFGQISSLRVAIEVLASKQSDAANFLEELIVRKELSDNFCYYNSNYHSIEGAHEWARATLKKHANNPRDFIYSFTEFEQAKTHDPAWNAAQNQLVRTGKMHGYMRMYWAKKALEWTESPEQAIEYLVRLNDFYSIDGGDPNGYVGILWSVAGLHDRPWFERDVYGTIRYMNAGGLNRKFKIENYIKQYS